MAKNKTTFWLGLGLGAVGGAAAAFSALKNTPMPNARVWQRIRAEKSGQVSAAFFMARVQSRYDSLLTGRPRFHHPVYDAHLTGSILPGLALYQQLQHDGFSSEQALEEVHRIFEAWFERFPPPNMRFNQLLKYTPENFDLFRRLVLLVTDRLFPAPGWHYELVEDGTHSLAFNMQRCFYLDVLSQYGAPELTPVFCRLDDLLMNAMPESIRWRRTQTMGLGGDCCDFRWVYVPVEEVAGTG